MFKFLYRRKHVTCDILIGHDWVKEGYFSLVFFCSTHYVVTDSIDDIQEHITKEKVYHA